MADGAQVKKGDMICEWDPYNAVIISEYEGKAVYDSVIEGVTYRDERDEQTGLSEKVVIESKDRMKNPIIRVVNKEGEEVKQYNLPVGAHVVVKDNARIKAGDILIKIPRASASPAAISPAVCRALRNCSRRAIRPIRPSCRKSTAKSRSAKSNAVIVKSSLLRNRAM